MKKLNLYIHFPFCTRKCNYCSFFSLVKSEARIPDYCDAILKEIELLGKTYRTAGVSTLYLGGGTPSLVSVHHIDRIISTCETHFNVSDDVEITLEANPDSLTLEKLTGYRLAGVNRLSIGLQAWQSRLLRYLGRVHDGQAFVKAYEYARQAGFNNINVDVIFGIPGQSMLDWQQTLAQIVALNPEHISCYSLELNNRSRFGHLYRQGGLKPVDDETDRRMFAVAKRMLATAGYRHYEVSNFAKPGYECRHNLDFWHHREYIGIGVGAHSYVNRAHTHHPDDIEAYIRDVLNTCIDTRCDLELERIEWVLLRLRLTVGFQLSEYRQQFGSRFTVDFSRPLNQLKCHRLMRVDRTSARLTDKGMDLYNQVISRLIDSG